MTRDQNRKDFPFVESWKAALEAAFGPIKVTHATNGTREVGERFEDRCKREGHTPCAYRPNGPSINQRFSTTRSSAKEAV